MKKIALSLLLALPVITGCGSSDMATYTNREKGYSLSLPRKWERVDRFMGSEFVVRQNTGDSGAFQSNVVLVIDRIAPGTNAHDYYELQYRTIISMQHQISNFKLIQNNAITMGGERGKGLEYSYTLGELNIHVISFLVAKNNLGYVLTGTATNEAFTDFKKNFDRITKSFHFE